MIYLGYLMSSPLFFRRLLGYILLIAVAVLAAVIIRYFLNISHGENRLVNRSDAVDVALKNIHFTESDASARKWQLFASSGEYDRVADRTSLKDIRFVIERAGRGGPVTVTARHGEYAHASKNVNLHDNVRAVTADGTRFETSKIMYCYSSRVISSQERVKLVDDALTVEGTGFDLDIDNREINVHNKVDATVYPGKRKR
jgi:LPS export ABC transporter protein LptC